MYAAINAAITDEIIGAIIGAAKNFIYFLFTKFIILFINF